MMMVCEWRCEVNGEQASSETIEELESTSSVMKVQTTEERRDTEARLCRSLFKSLNLIPERGHCWLKSIVTKDRTTRMATQTTREHLLACKKEGGQEKKREKEREREKAQEPTQEVMRLKQDDTIRTKMITHKETLTNAG
jgi:septum formation inhibitor MinC